MAMLLVQQRGIVELERRLSLLERQGNLRQEG
jgi:hypothetical protein